MKIPASISALLGPVTHPGYKLPVASCGTSVCQLEEHSTESVNSKVAEHHEDAMRCQGLRALVANGGIGNVCRQAERGFRGWV